jgi:2-polyprenyl-6-methoxyphenol hydroxylase-like FAD-dependent oxidoreductase
VRRLIDPQAPDPLYTGLLGFGGRASCDAMGRTDAMYFAFGKRAFFGYWTAPDGGTMWFANLPREVPMTMAEARAVPVAHWLNVLRELYADDKSGSALIRHTSADQLFVAGAGEALPPIPVWHRGRSVLVGDAVHAPSSSSGQGASLALESAVQLARCLRDVNDVPGAFAAYENLRRPRVEKVAADAAKTNSNKTAGPVARALMGLLMPLAVKTILTPERMFGALHGHRIEWEEVIAT